MWKEIGSSRFFGFCSGIAVLLFSATACIAVLFGIGGSSKGSFPSSKAAVATEARPSWREPTLEEFREICRAFLDSPAHRKHLQEALDRGLKCRCEVRPDVGAGIACYLPNQGTTI